MLKNKIIFTIFLSFTLLNINTSKAMYVQEKNPYYLTKDDIVEMIKENFIFPITEEDINLIYEKLNNKYPYTDKISYNEETQTFIYEIIEEVLNYHKSRTNYFENTSSEEDIERHSQ